MSVKRKKNRKAANAENSVNKQSVLDNKDTSAENVNAAGDTNSNANPVDAAAQKKTNSQSAKLVEEKIHEDIVAFKTNPLDKGIDNSLENNNEKVPNSANSSTKESAKEKNGKTGSAVKAIPAEAAADNADGNVNTVNTNSADENTEENFSEKGNAPKENLLEKAVNNISEDAQKDINAADQTPAAERQREKSEEDFIAPKIIKAEKEEHKPLKLRLWRHITAGLLLIIALGVLIVSRVSREFADWFCFNIYPVFSGIGSRIWGVFPFSAAEIFVFLVILGALTGIVFLVRYAVKHRGNRIKAFFNGFSWAELTAAILFLLVTFNCLVGYNRTPFSEYSGLTLREYTADELKELTLYLIEQANEIAEKVDLDGEGRPVKPWDFNKYAVEAMESLGEKYDVLKTYYPQPKGVIASSLMSNFNLAGIYFPVTVEANFNQAMPVSSQGFTACHELSHLSGFIREDEANFIAFMACRESEITYFQYSGYLGALTYCLNALYSAVSSEEYSAVCGKLSPIILNEYSYRNSYWSPYQKQVTYKVSSMVNDTYLKANNQADGTKSYGRMVDLMLAEYFN